MRWVFVSLLNLKWQVVESSDETHHIPFSHESFCFVFKSFPVHSIPGLHNETGHLASKKNEKPITDNYKNIKTEILSASVRNTDHVKEVAKAGTDISTIPPKVFHELYKHDLTDKGLKIFLEDWAKTHQKIL